MSANIKQITRVPIALKAPTPEELSVLCLENNLRFQTEFEYFQIMKEGREWIAWYYADVEKYPLLNNE